MALQRTPPNKFTTSSSDGNIPASIDIDANNYDVSCSNIRKRKQPDTEDAHEQFKTYFEENFNKHMSTWNDKITDCINKSVAAAVNLSLSGELSKLSSALGEISANMVKLNKDNIDFNKSLSEVKERASEMEKSLRFSTDRQDLFDARLKTIETNVAHTEASSAQTQALEYKIASMEQQARQCNAEIFNIPDRRGENLISILERLGDAIKQPIRASDIVAIHRVPHADQNDRRPKNIIVKFSNRMLRDNVIAASRKTKGLESALLNISGPSATIYVNEHLTLQNKMLFRQCREAGKKHNYKYVWARHGVVLARKDDTSPVIAIRNAQDLTKIK